VGAAHRPLLREDLARRLADQMDAGADPVEDRRLPGAGGARENEQVRSADR
jgi:Arc/MetJ family transcription regulator